MKNRIHVFTILFLTTVISVSCFKEPFRVSGIPTKNLSVQVLRDLYKGQDILLNENIIGVTPLAGTVISDMASGNIEAGKFVIVQTKNNETAGITISLKDNSSIDLVPGDSVVFDIKGTMLTANSGTLSISGLDVSRIFVVKKDCKVEPVAVALKDLSENFYKYESRLVLVSAADVLPAPVPNGTYEGEYDLYDGTAGTDIKLHTSANASFASEEIPTNANFIGIPVLGNGVKQVRIRNINDVSVTSIPHNADLVITAIQFDPFGSDTRTAGEQVFPSGVSVMHHGGGYEYIQMLALRDIDFSVTPFSVVIAIQGGPGADGWATGGSRTCKYNITEGTAAKGEFVYMGGNERVINGTSEACGRSYDLSGRNWVRILQIPEAGDDFGSSKSAILGNYQGSANTGASGIAVFEGTNVTSESVPIDAVFYGTFVGNAYDAVNQVGYRIPANDRYNPINPETGEAQPFFGQGTNTYIYTTPINANGDMPILGGVVTPNAWITPRSATVLVTYNSSCNLNITEKDIEEGTGVTRVR